MENGATEVQKTSLVNGKTAAVAELPTSDESEPEKQVDLDSDGVDCTIIEDDFDLEELMKKKVIVSDALNYKNHQNKAF